MRILIVTPHFYPEYFRINDIAKELVSHGNKVTVLCQTPNYPKGSFFNGYSWFNKVEESIDNIDVIRLRVIPRGKNRFMLALNYFSYLVSGFLKALLIKNEYDLVYTFQTSPVTVGLISNFIKKRFDIPNITYVQDLWPDSFSSVTNINNKLINKILESISKTVYSNSDILHITSEKFKSSLLKYKDESKINYIPQYAESVYKPSVQKSNKIDLKRKLNLTFTGNVGVAQGLDLLLDVALLLKDTNLDVVFNIVGDGSYLQEMKNLVIKNELSHYFNFVGRVSPDSIPSILNSSTMALIILKNTPLFNKTVPAKLQTYMACGAPIFSIANGEISEIVKKSKSGLTAEYDAQSIVEKIYEIDKLSNSDIENMKQNSKEYSNKYFCKKNLIDSIISDMNSLV